MNRFSDRLLNVAMTAMVVLFNPLVKTAIGIVESIVFIVLVALVVLHTISFQSFIVLSILIAAVPILGGLCLFVVLHFCTVLSGREETHTDSKV
jgi:hypothetical protein